MSKGLCVTTRDGAGGRSGLHDNTLHASDAVFSESKFLPCQYVHS
jgi:hypothetical protein